MSDTGDQVTSAGVDAPAPVQAPDTGHNRHGEGWFRRGVLVGAIVVLVVIVAGGFFTIGWFTSTRGEDGRQQNTANGRMNMNQRGWGDQSFQGGSPRGFDQQGSNQSQGSQGNGQGMVAPQQGRNHGQQSTQQATPENQSTAPSQQYPPAPATSN